MAINVPEETINASTQALRNKQRREEAEKRLIQKRAKKRLEQRAKEEEVARMEMQFWENERKKKTRPAAQRPEPAAAECSDAAGDPVYLRHRAANPGPIMGGISNKDPYVSFAEAAARSDPEGLVPWPVRKGCAWLIQHGLEEEGLFRIPGSNRTLRTWVDRMNTDPCFELLEPNKEFKPSTVASLIVKFLMGQDRDWTLGDQPGHIREQCREVAREFKGGNFDRKALLSRVHNILHELPPGVLATLRTLSELMSKVAERGQVNKMDPAKLALCMGQAAGPFAEIMFSEYQALFVC